MLKDLIYTVASLLKMEDVCDYLNVVNEKDFNDEVSIDEMTKPKEIEFIINLCNLVIEQITREFMPLYLEELTSSNENCEINFSGLSQKVNQIISVSFADGIGTTYRVFPEYIKVGNPQEKFLVNYSYIPKQVSSLEDEFALPMGLSEFTVAYGVCAEYCLIEMLYDEADMWESKFKTSLQNSIKKLRERKIPSRGWV